MKSLDINNLKILYIESSSGCSGSASALAYIIRHLNKEIFKPVIAINNFGPKFEKINGIEILKLKNYKEPNKLFFISLLLYFVKYILPEAIKIYFIIKKKRISLVHINTNIMLGIPTIIASKIAKVPCICHIRETRQLIKRERFFAKWVDRFIILNKDAYGIYKKDIPEEKLSIIYDGIDLDRLNLAEEGRFKQEFNLDSAQIVGVIGRIVEGKGQKEFILAAKTVLKSRPNVKFVIVGDSKGESSNDYYGQVRELAEKSNLNSSMIFTGWRNDIKNIISELDIFVFTSTTYPEGLPNSIIEAMALKKPVVATNIPGSSDIVVDGETGFLVPPGDIKAMAEKIICLLDNKEIAKKMGERSRIRTEELFDINKQVKKIEKVYEEVLS